MSESNFSDWEGQIFDCLVGLLNVDHSDAEGIAGAHSFELMQEWAKGSSPEQAAKRISEL